MSFGLNPSTIRLSNGGRPLRLDRSPHPYSRSQGQESSQEQSASQGLGAFNLAHPGEGDFGAPNGHGPKIKTPPATSESEADADDDSFRFLKALPASVPRRRKGLRSDQDLADQDTPLDTPNERPTPQGYFQRTSNPVLTPLLGEHSRRLREKHNRRRRAELTRRTAEALSLAAICFVVICDAGVWAKALAYQQVLLRSISILLSLFILYPVRLLWPQCSGTGFRIGSIRIPYAFDPAPLLYPVVLPVLTALSIRSETGPIMFNIVLGLSTLPSQLLPKLGSYNSFDPLHWLLTLIPHVPFRSFVQSSKTPPISHTADLLSLETCALLYPLHQCLLPPLYYLTTSSLLWSELQLLSVSIINLLLLSSTPQAKAMSILIWIGGVGMFMFCNEVLKWNVALERIPDWRLRRVSNAVGVGRSFVNALSENLNTREKPDDRDTAIVFQQDRAAPDLRDGTHATNGTVSKRPEHGESARSAHQRVQTSPKDFSPSPVQESTVLKNDGFQASAAPQDFSSIVIARKSQRSRSMSTSAQWYLSLSTGETSVRKWMYTVYSYIVIILLILGPIRILIASEALQGWEPFGWAIGFLFGDNQSIRTTAEDMRLLSWIPLPQARRPQFPALWSDQWVDGVRDAFGKGNTRLVLFCYWGCVIAGGLLVVLRLLSELAEVDTRRKVFHGMMVVMLLPTAFIDPCFLALGLTLVLAVFLLLDLLRAAQLRPLSKPLATFLAPYTDGRDFRGPVIVSHIFLLVGCAIPFWLSLSSYERQPAEMGDPWAGWELLAVKGQSRDLSMLAGVICVGMGDAAASLVGRRYGRRKWPWAGGKSLEGSAAFAVAVTVGLMVGKAWLHIGGWQGPWPATGTWLLDLGKAAIAASGASFTEAVLTGANDNVVVPIILWLLVRGLGM